MYRYSSGNRVNVADLKSKQRILAIITVILLAAVIVLSIFVSSSAVFRSKAKSLMTQKMVTHVSAALEEVNKLEGSTTSTTAQKLGIIRGYVCSMETLNSISVSLYGESGRFAPNEAFTALYSDIASYESLVQGAKTSTLDIRTLLQEHIKSLQGYIEGKLES